MDIAKHLRDITKDDAIYSYHELKEMTVSGPDFSRVGLKALDYFFLHHRIKAKTKHHISFYDAIKDDKLTAHLNSLVVKYKKKRISEYETDDALLKAQYQVFQLWYGTINQFRPIVAKWVYTTLKPKVGILDFSSGWGGRALAAMSMGIPYVGIDANKKLETSYRNMIKQYEPQADIRIIFKPSEEVDFSRFKYDLIFTSPPYFMLEEYEKMPKYGSKEGFLEIFFRPVVHNAWTNLLPGGNMALNMPAEMYEAVKDMLPKVKRELALPLSNRHPVNTVVGAKLGKHDKERHELIYVWHKQR